MGQDEVNEIKLKFREGSPSDLAYKRGWQDALDAAYVELRGAADKSPLTSGSMTWFINDVIDRLKGAP